MHTWADISQVPASLTGSVVTIGNFDGVHRGHAAVLNQVVSQARSRGLAAIAMTFDPHPAQIHRPETAPPAITSLQEKLRLIEKLDVDATMVVPYTLEFASQDAETFVLKYLVETLRAKIVVAGTDIRFGKDNAGDLAYLQHLGQVHGFEVQAIADVGPRHPELMYRRWSSTLVRQLLEQGDMAGANDILGRYHTVSSTVVPGSQRGRELGFRTANLGMPARGLIPADGIYSGWLSCDLDDLPAAISIGTNPTFGENARSVEAHIVDGQFYDLYGKDVVLHFTDWLRPMQSFNSLSELVDQMNLDVALTKEKLVHWSLPYVRPR